MGERSGPYDICDGESLWISEACLAALIDIATRVESSAVRRYLVRARAGDTWILVCRTLYRVGTAEFAREVLPSVSDWTAYIRW